MPGFIGCSYEMRKQKHLLHNFHIFYVQQNNVKLSKLQLSKDMLPHVIPGPKISVVIYCFYAKNIVNPPGHPFI